MQHQFDIRNAPTPPLRAEPRFASPAGAAGHVQGVAATPGGLIRSTLMAGAAAVAILTFFWLPAEYGIDPTGVGGMLGLTDMGAIKQQLAGEAAAQDAAAAVPVAAGDPAPLPADLAARLNRIDTQLAQIAAVIGADIAVLPAASAEAASETAAGVEPAPEVAPGVAPGVVVVPAVAEPAAPVAVAGWRDEMVFTLAPSEAKEIKLVMAAGDIATFEWVSTGSGVNYTQHGDDGGTNEVRFEDGRAAAGQDGAMTAPFAGNHGWFWRNRGDAPVTVTLRVSGAYAEMLEVSQP